MSDDHREEFWDRLEDVRAGMLEVDGAFLPMSHNLEPEDGNIWFLTAKGTGAAAAAAAGAATRYIVSDSSEGIYAEITGRLEESHSREKLDEVWSAIASTWYDQGKQDPDLVLMRLIPASAEVWVTPTSGIAFMYSVAKAKLVGGEPDMGEAFSLTFAPR